MTTATAAIVTALGSGPATARDLSQRLDGIGYDNIRQALRRLAVAGTVTKLKRGLYAASDDAAITTITTTTTTNDATPHREIDPVAWSQALAGFWADFEAMNDPRDPRAWG